MSPVQLGLLARQVAQPQIRLGRTTRTMTGDEVAEVIGAAAVAGSLHGVEAAGSVHREVLQGLEYERHVRLDCERGRVLGRPAWASTRITVPWFTCSWRAMVRTRHFSTW